MSLRDKIRQLYAFLKAANELRFRPVRALADQPKVVRLADLPNHPAVQIFRPLQDEVAPEVPDTLLRVKRPTLTRCPPPPASILSWLLPNWDDPAQEATVAESQNDTDDQGLTVTVRFDQDHRRGADFDDWSERRSAWAGPELAARGAMASFQIFYDIYSFLEKDGEELELLAADGHLLWQTVSVVDGPVTISHPILLKRVELRFEPSVPEFTIHETDREPELYGGLFVDLQEVAAAIAERKNELAAGGYHPLGGQDTDAFLQSFIQTVSPVDGVFLDAPPGDGASTTPRLYRDPVLVLRKRVAGIANAVDAIIGDIEAQEVFPPALAQITGTLDEWQALGLGNGADGRHGLAAGFNDDDVLLAKEANKEQLQIIRRLEQSGSVIVQGPPGTGKTHTIGNLIGHLLAQGKSILVTAQTAIALRVVRDQVPDILRPLAVSVLGSDRDARQHLESAVRSITERLTGKSASELLDKAHRIESDRRELLSQIRQTGVKLREALDNEYREIALGDWHFTPSQAARFVAEHRAVHGWIPRPVRLGADLSLSVQELTRLYAIGDSFVAAEERDARLPLPDPNALPSGERFAMMVAEYQQLLSQDFRAGEERWAPSDRSSQALEDLATQLRTEFSDDLRRQAWRPHAITAGIHGGGEREVWERLIAHIDRAVEANSKCALVLDQRPQLSPAMPVPQQIEIAKRIGEYIAGGGKLGFLQLATRAEWRRFVRTASVAAGQPHHVEHFAALARRAELEVCRINLEMPWDSMIAAHLGQPFCSLGPTPELACRALVAEIRRCLDWHHTVWLPLSTRLRAEGLRLDEILARIPRETSPISEYLAIDLLVSSVLPGLLVAELGRRKRRECESGFRQLANLVAQVDPTVANRGCLGRIMDALRLRSPQAYSQALDYARRLLALRPLIAERDARAGRLRLVAPGWADQIIRRVPPHDAGRIPGDVAMAWTWRQLHDTLVERDRLDAHELQRDIDQQREQLRQVTRELIDARAWGTQLERLQGNQSIRQALMGWLDTTGRLVSTRQLARRQELLSEARRSMKRCAEAVPVWIMPISIMAESFDPCSTRFDVVIIDEASQADLNALIPLYLGRQVIVVGDHEQVTPLGVGQGQAMLDNLRRAMLRDIPNAHLFDHQCSIYDIGRQSFGDAIRLVEHFRCVPEIIGFSNQLSYHGEIRPLRESNSTEIKPACVACRVDGVRERDTNPIEARRIIDTIKAMLRHRSYEGKTIGVISMLGEAQALLIQAMLHREINGIEIAKRRIQAGISGEFQGDERDIVFLSMVDSPPAEGLLRATREGAFELIKKRYNVAASRARDQLWVVHSFDPDRHLAADDIRFSLLRHVRDPLAYLREIQGEVGRAESQFERDVLTRLANAGFRVRSQWPVGYYRIDLVVEGAGQRLAIECDGDRYHPIERLADDMARQAVLERLGWRFVRIRGSAFYRDAEGAMRPVFERLQALGIPPEANHGGDPAAGQENRLIDELDALIGQGNPAGETGLDPEVAPIQPMPAAADPLPDNEPEPMPAEDRGHRQVRELLDGRPAPYEPFLRDLARVRGFQRLGRRVREDLEAELELMARHGQLEIGDDEIRPL
ncbi:MAG: AAA domain-containing protein [Accumulibacter sp.]